jgi:hypothetical protein
MLVRKRESFENIRENIYVLKCASERKTDLYKLSSFTLKLVGVIQFKMLVRRHLNTFTEILDFKS